MIVVRVELWSAITGERTELARMRICNDGSSAGRRRSYDGETFTGRNTAALDRGAVTRRGRLKDFSALDRHVWALVAHMLNAMGYGA